MWKYEPNIPIIKGIIERYRVLGVRNSDLTGHVARKVITSQSIYF
jgi:hypothetical protein